jgi:hypothetical protein
MIGKLLAIVALVLIALYVASSLHLLSFSLPYGSATAPANLNVQTLFSELKAAFSV